MSIFFLSRARFSVQRAGLAGEVSGLLLGLISGLLEIGIFLALKNLISLAFLTSSSIFNWSLYLFRDPLYSVAKLNSTFNASSHWVRVTLEHELCWSYENWGDLEKSGIGLALKLVSIKSHSLYPNEALEILELLILRSVSNSGLCGKVRLSSDLRGTKS